MSDNHHGTTSSHTKVSLPSNDKNPIKFQKCFTNIRNFCKVSQALCTNLINGCVSDLLTICPCTKYQAES